VKRTSYELLLVPSFPALGHAIPLSNKYSPQHPMLDASHFISAVPRSLCQQETLMIETMECKLHYFTF